MPKPKLDSAKADLIEALDSSKGLFTATRPFAQGSYQQPAGAALSRKQAERIVALGFLAEVAAWEEFVLGAFIRYLVGAASPSGFVPPLRLSACSTIPHATDVLGGEADFKIEKRYISWSSWDEVEKTAKIYFHSGEPFTRLTAEDRKRLAYAQIIRNRVAHASAKCVAQFVSTAKDHLGIQHNFPLPQGTDPGRLLLSRVTHIFPANPNQTYFEAYDTWFRDLADKLVP